MSKCPASCRGKAADCISPIHLVSNPFRSASKSTAIYTTISTAFHATKSISGSDKHEEVLMFNPS